jgi:hypothetical protein
MAHTGQQLHEVFFESHPPLVPIGRWLNATISEAAIPSSEMSLYHCWPTLTSGWDSCHRAAAKKALEPIRPTADRLTAHLIRRAICSMPF